MCGGKTLSLSVLVQYVIWGIIYNQPHHHCLNYVQRISDISSLFLLDDMIFSFPIPSVIHFEGLMKFKYYNLSVSDCGGLNKSD